MPQAQATSHQHRHSRQTSFAWTSHRYARRTPEATLLFKVVSQNFRSFEDLCATEGKRLPLHVTAEFEAFLKCGVLAHGFLRFKCEDCKFERLVAFSCKKRGFCASCGARKMNETSAHLSDNVFPPATLIRQWVLSIPVPLRFMCARNSTLQSKILRLTNSVIAKSIKTSVPNQNQKNIKLQTGAVTLIQRFGGHVNLNIHFHMLHVQGAWEINDEKTSATFYAAQNPTQSPLLEVIRKIAAGTIKILKRMNLLEQNNDGFDVVASKEEQDDDDTLANIQAASTQNKIALGLRKEKISADSLKNLKKNFDLPSHTSSVTASQALWAFRSTLA